MTARKVKWVIELLEFLPCDPNGVNVVIHSFLALPFTSACPIPQNKVLFRISVCSIFVFVVQSDFNKIFCQPGVR